MIRCELEILSSYCNHDFFDDVTSRTDSLRQVLLGARSGVGNWHWL